MTYLLPSSPDALSTWIELYNTFWLFILHKAPEICRYCDRHQKNFLRRDFLRLEMPLDNWFRLLNLVRKYARQAAIFLVEKNWRSFIACSFISGIWNCVSPSEFEQTSRPRFRVICLHGQCKYCSHLTHTHTQRITTVKSAASVK